MEERNIAHPRDVKLYDSERLREEFLVEGLFREDEIKTVYSYGDRMIIGGAFPKNSLELAPIPELESQFFLERREMGIMNIGSPGVVSVDGVEYLLETRDGLYIGMGAQEVKFSSKDKENPSKFYFISTPAHHTYETTKISHQDVQPVELGSMEASNQRALYKYIHPDGVKSCQLVMGMTALKTGSVWNSMPPHTHSRRAEVYLYFDLPKEDIIFHFMGEGNETRHMVIKNEEGIISPYWSIHSGVGTRNYSFIWAMAGENQLFSDVNPIELTNLK